MFLTFLSFAFFLQKSNSGCRAAELTNKDGHTFHVYFNGGCYFENATDDVVHARYASNNLAAVIKIPVGNGYAILSGVINVVCCYYFFCLF